tara:strand:+ start:328 stop:525 length:198 start_codon:yes stop_codon:yes gene_type:complete
MKILFKHLQHEVDRLKELNKTSEFETGDKYYERIGKIKAYENLITLINEDLFAELYEQYMTDGHA